jgi:hypothetical protein
MYILSVCILRRWAGQALFGTLTPDIVVLTSLYSIAGVYLHTITFLVTVYAFHDH